MALEPIACSDSAGIMTSYDRLSKVIGGCSFKAITSLRKTKIYFDRLGLNFHYCILLRYSNNSKFVLASLITLVTETGTDIIK